jgi:hypothetical protein
LIEWPEGEREATKYWLATVDKNMSFRALVDLAKNCDGGSSAITWSSSNKSGSGTTRGAAGRASIITAHFASQFTGS